ncbi:anthranilate synthase component I family protein [Thermodesulfovibrionales bacterium]|nr:anthranilate synthase component I family protein [Thermodesulfovibrionales bacterium]
MNLNLSKKDFLSATESGIHPLYVEIPYSEPPAIYESLGCQPDSILLESVKGSHKTARYSFIAFDPYLVFTVIDGEINIRAKKIVERQRDKKWTEGEGILPSTVSFGHPLRKLEELVTNYPQKSDPKLPPFQGGAVGLLSYGFARYIENIPKNAFNDIRIPDAHFLIVDKVIAFDHLLNRAWLIIAPGIRPWISDAEADPLNIINMDRSDAYEKAGEELQTISYRLQAKKQSRGLTLPLTPFSSSLRYEMSKGEYIDIVRRAKEYIAAGDILQANLSQRISQYIGNEDPWEIYKVLRGINPSPFAAYANFGDYQIVSSSPERLIRVKDNVIETRPIAGTRPRGRNSSEDELMRAELLLNEKERAEHIMLVDLERNDIGRVSEYGTVVVDELMITEEYSHVIHIISNIKGILAREKTCFDAIKAIFPGGTITGAPKIRCMEIIDELEPISRGPYTGALGYIGFSGNMDFNIIIRTFVIKGGLAYVQAGAGIVADSDPEREYHETLKKAEALIKTIEVMRGGSGEA